MHEFKIKFYLPPDNGRPHERRSILARIQLDNQRDYLATTKVAVADKDWNGSQEKVNLNTPEGRLMNHRLTTLRKNVTDIYHLHESDEHLPLTLIKQAYLASVKAKSDKPGICAFFRKYIEDNVETMSVSNHYLHLNVAGLFGQFVGSSLNALDISFDDIYPKMLHDFMTYLYKEESERNLRTIDNKISSLRTLFGAAKELGMMEHDPFEGFSFSTVNPVTASLLTVDDIKRLKKAEFDSKRLDKVRDCFLFSCYTGMSYQELKELTKDKLTMLNGSTWILFTGDVEDSPRYIPLLPYSATIIKKYASDDAPLLLPLISQQKTNSYLKEIAELCGIDKPLTFKLAVRSFMKIALSAGASIDCVSHVAGKSWQETKAFAQFSPERIEDEMAMFAARMGRDRPSSTE